MAKYKKKPIVEEAERFIEAEQWLPGGNPKKWPGAGIPDKFGAVWRFYAEGDVFRGQIEIRKGDIKTVLIGDWIITKKNGEKSVLRPNIFEQTYEKVEEQ